MDDVEAFKKELEKLMPTFNKPVKKEGSYLVGIVAWIFVALFACAAAWVVGVMAGLVVSGYHLTTRLLG